MGFYDNFIKKICQTWWFVYEMNRLFFIRKEALRWERVNIYVGKFMVTMLEKIILYSHRDIKTWVFL